MVNRHAEFSAIYRLDTACLQGLSVKEQEAYIESAWTSCRRWLNEAAYAEKKVILADSVVKSSRKVEDVWLFEMRGSSYSLDSARQQNRATPRYAPAVRTPSRIQPPVGSSGTRSTAPRSAPVPPTER